MIEIFRQDRQALFIECFIPPLHLFEKNIAEIFQPYIQRADIHGLIILLKSIRFQNRAFYPVFFRIRQYLLQVFPPFQIQIHLGKVFICLDKIGEIPQADTRRPHHAPGIQLAPVRLHGRRICRKNLVFIDQPLGSLLAQFIFLHLQIDLRHLQQNPHVLYIPCQDAFSFFDSQCEIILLPKTQVMVTLHPDQTCLPQPVPVSFLFFFVIFMTVLHFFLQGNLPLTRHGNGFLIFPLLYIEL